MLFCGLILYIVLMDIQPHNILGLNLKEVDFKTYLERQLWALVQWQAQKIVMPEKRVAELQKRTRN